MDYKEIVHSIHNKQLETFCMLSDFQNKVNIPVLLRKKRGLYWLWIDLNFSKLKNVESRENTKEVPISKLVTSREHLKGICHIEKEGFRIVYNGVGGYKKLPAAFGLRERIQQELSCNDHRTGTLNLLNRKGIDAKNVAISFFDFDNPANQFIINELNSKEPYLDFGKELEMIWRLEFGTPILCRH